MKRKLSIATERFPVRGHFSIARGSRREAVVVAVSIAQDGKTGRAECTPYARYDETSESVTASIESLQPAIEAGASRHDLQNLLPAGAARNALDCALWDLDAKISRIPAFVAAGLDRLKSVTTCYTLSLDSPDAMAEAARQAAHRPILKVKLGKPGDLERIAAIRRCAPASILIADANEGWNEENLVLHLTACKKAGFALVEQPLPAGHDSPLASFSRPLPICADESLHDRSDLARVAGLYDFVNIKLDKAGGLTEALRLAEAARAKGFKLMVGCMLGTSLGMAPALLLAQNAEFVDLDGPLLLEHDRKNGLHYQASLIHPPEPHLWG